MSLEMTEERPRIALTRFDIVAGSRDFITEVVDGQLVEGLAVAMQWLVDRVMLRLTLGAKAVQSVEGFSHEKIGQQYVDSLFPRGR